MTAADTGDRDPLAEVLRGHLWNDAPGRTCGCGWQADSHWTMDPTTPNRVEQWLAHVADAVRAAGHLSLAEVEARVTEAQDAALAPVLAVAELADRLCRAHLDEGTRPGVAGAYAGMASAIRVAVSPEARERHAATLAEVTARAEAAEATVRRVEALRDYWRTTAGWASLHGTANIGEAAAWVLDAALSGPAPHADPADRANDTGTPRPGGDT